MGFGSLIRGQNLKTNTNFIKKTKKKKGKERQDEAQITK